MILGLIARGIVWGIELIQLATEGLSAGQKLIKTAREGKAKPADVADPIPLTYRDVAHINQAARNAGHEGKASGDKGK